MPLHREVSHVSHLRYRIRPDRFFSLDASRTQEGLQAEIVEVLFKRSQDAAVGLTPEELDASVHIYVKMVAGKDKKPYAFVQWMMPGIAEKMLKDIQKNRIYVSNRPIRAEWARASRSSPSHEPLFRKS